MTTQTLSPDQIKAIAAQIRATEKDRLGAQLPNTTALNAITRALGLGLDFRTFKASYADAPVSTGAVTMSHILFVFENKYPDEDIMDTDEKARLIAQIENHGYQVDLTPGAHGFSCLMPWSEREDRTLSDLKFLHNELRELIEVLVEAMELPEIKAEAVWQTRESDPILAVNFRYHENNQVCTSNVDEATWRAREQLGLSDEAALLLLGGDCEISSGYDADDITVEDVLRDVAYFDD